MRVKKNRKRSFRIPFLSRELGMKDVRKYTETKFLTKKQKEILLLYNAIAYDMLSDYRHKWWLKHVEYLPGAKTVSRNSKGTATNRNFKNKPEYVQFSQIENYLFNEYNNLKYGGVINQGNYCLGCECCQPYQQNNGIAYRVNELKCKQWASLRWCPLLKQALSK